MSTKSESTEKAHTPHPSGHGCPKCGAGVGPDHANEITEIGSVGASWSGYFDAETGAWEDDGNGADMCWDSSEVDSYQCRECEHEWPNDEQLPPRVVIQVRGGCVVGGYSIAGAAYRTPEVVTVDWDNIEDGDDRPELPVAFSYTEDGTDIVKPPHAVAW